MSFIQSKVNTKWLSVVGDYFDYQLNYIIIIIISMTRYVGTIVIIWHIREVLNLKSSYVYSPYSFHGISPFNPFLNGLINGPNSMKIIPEETRDTKCFRVSFAIFQ